jgi:hypothetical protein
MDNNAVVTNIESKYGVRAIQSEAKGLFYIEDDDKKDIGILVLVDGKPFYVVLNRKQAYALAKEFKDVVKMRFNDFI